MQALVPAATIIAAAFGFFYQVKYRLTSLEGKIQEASSELHALGSAMVTIATQSVRLGNLEAEVSRLRDAK